MSPIDSFPSSKPESKAPLLSKSEWSKIKEISDRYPEKKPSIYDRFRFFDAMPSEIRPHQAYKALKAVDRAGVVQRGYEGECVENIHEHSCNIIYALTQIFKDEALVLRIFGEDADIPDLLRTGIKIARHHDLPEVIVTDLSLTDMDRMSRDEKSFLEDCANRVIFESNTRRRTMIERYEEKQTKMDKLIKVLDALESGVDSVAIGMTKNHFEEFIGTAEKTARKYPNLSLAFSSKAITNLRNTYALWVNDLQTSYPCIAKRRRAIMDLVL